MARRRREPTIEVREHSCADGSVTEMWSVRYYDVAGTRRRLRCGSRVEADFERARLVLAEARGEPVLASFVAADDGSGLTLAGLWPMYLADAQSRLARSTLRRIRAHLGSPPRPALRSPPARRDPTPPGLRVASGAARRGRRRRGSAVRHGPAASDVYAGDRVGRCAGQPGERRPQAPPGSSTRDRAARPRTSSVCAGSCSTRATTARPRWSASSPTPACGPARRSASNGATSATAPS
jgi:hypothetical protein